MGEVCGYVRESLNFFVDQEPSISRDGAFVRSRIVQIGWSTSDIMDSAHRNGNMAAAPEDAPSSTIFSEI